MAAQTTEIKYPKIDEYRMNQYFLNVGFLTAVGEGKRGFDGVNYGLNVVVKKGLKIGLEHHVKKNYHAINWEFGFLIRGGRTMHYKKFRSD